MSWDTPKHTLRDGALRVDVWEPRNPNGQWLVVASLGGARQSSAKRKTESAALAVARGMLRKDEF